MCSQCDIFFFYITLLGHSWFSLHVRLAILNVSIHNETILWRPLYKQNWYLIYCCKDILLLTFEQKINTRHIFIWNTSLYEFTIVVGNESRNFLIEFSLEISKLKDNWSFNNDIHGTRARLGNFGWGTIIQCRDMHKMGFCNFNSLFCSI